MMINKITFLIISIQILGCSGPELNDGYDTEQFTKELIELKEYFQIPGIAVLIKKGGHTLHEDYLGYADIDQRIPMDSATTIPMASLTKIFTAVLVWQLVDQGMISLEEPINRYLINQNIADSIKLEHALSHTSQGAPGQNFYYNNNRFMLLEEVIEKLSEQSFKSRMYEKIIEPLKLQHTYLLQDSIQLANENRKIARPYFLGGEMKNGFQQKEITVGFIDYGYSAAAGISSTVRDLSKFSAAIDNGRLMENGSRDKMFTPYKPNLPYGLGVFTQEFMNKQLVWGYGQYDCYSSLFLRIPEDDLVFVIAANNNLMSDPARLIAGDVTYSLFALSFLKTFVFNLGQELLFEDQNSLSTVSNRIQEGNSEFYRKKLIAQSVAASFMARYDETEGLISKNILRKVFEMYPNHQSYSDIILMHNLSMLKFMDSFRGKGEFLEFDDQLLDMGKSLLEIDKYNPYANYYMASYYQEKGMNDSTSFYYSQIINAKNFSPWWYTKEAEKWIDENEN